MANFLSLLKQGWRKVFTKSAPARLTIELVPETCWMTNVRSNISEQEWDKIRKAVAKAAGHRCEICGGVGPKWPVECHEIWHYDDQKHVQSLGGLIALCPSCHEVKHIGRASLHNRGHAAAAHLAKVNGWSAVEAKSYITEQFRVWEERSSHEWHLDVTWLKKHGIELKTTDREKQRV